MNGNIKMKTEDMANMEEKIESQKDRIEKMMTYEIRICQAIRQLAKDLLKDEVACIQHQERLNEIIDDISNALNEEVEKI